jgi:hypothetical protein
MNKNLAEILAANLDYLKVNNIEKAIGLNKTALVRMIARKEIPEKHREVVFKWWAKWVATLIVPVIEENNKPENKERIMKERNPYIADEVGATGSSTFIEVDAEAIKKDTTTQRYDVRKKIMEN